MDIKQSVTESVTQTVGELKDLLKQFGSDGCSGVPEMGQTDCCLQHDIDYRKLSGVSRLEADTKLKKCIQGKGKWYSKTLGWVFFVGVRAFGWGPYNRK